MKAPDAKRWKRIKKIFLAALNLKPDERNTYVEEACKGDAVLRAEVYTLLNSLDGAGDFMEPQVKIRGPGEEVDNEPPSLESESPS